MHSNAYANHGMVKSSKWMIGAVLRGTARQMMVNRQVPKPIWNTSSNTCIIPETSGKQPSKEGELKCYECGQKGHIAAVREDDSEEIVKVLLPIPRPAPRSLSMPRSQPKPNYLLYSTLMFCHNQAPISVTSQAPIPSHDPPRSSILG